MGGSASSSPAVQKSLANFMDAAMGGLGPIAKDKPKNGIEKLMQSYVANGERPDGMIAPGNLNLYKRPRVLNKDEGGVSTVYSEGRNVNGEEVLLPRVVGNKILSSDDALKHYLKTGEHLGKFSSEKASSDYADALHLQQQALIAKPALDQYSKQFRDMPDAVIRGVGDAVASIPDMAIAAGKLAMEGGFNPRMGQSERVKRFADTTYMPINPMMQDALTRAGVAETSGGNNLTRFVSGAMAPYAMGKYAGAVGDAVGAAERGALSNAERGMVKLTDDLPMDEASRIVTYRGSDLHPDILNAIKPIVGQKQRSQELSNIKKMQIPIEEMEAKRRLLPKRDLPVFDVNNIPTGSWLLGSPADAMKGAAELTEINGLKLKAPVRLDGGIDYAQMHKSPGWASEESAGTAWKNSVNNQLAEGKDIWPAIVAMSARGTTSTKAMANLQTQRLANIEIPRRSADAMTKMLRQYKHSVKTKDGYRETFPFKDAPSFRNQKEMFEFIDGLELTQRGRFFEALDRAKTLDEGVPNLIPDLASARFALADENQLGIPAGSSGMLITRMNRPMTMAEVLKGQEGYHPGYRYRQSGFDVAGKTDVSIPPQVFWKDAFQKIIDRGRSPEEAAVVLPRPKGGGPLLQEVTNEWKDLVSKVIEDNKKSGSGRNALLPLGAGGAGAISVDYDEEERKLKRNRKRK